MNDIIILAAGAFGALVKDLVQDGTLTLPKKENGAIALGFIGGMIVGAFVGYVVDGQPLTAALGGYAGSSLLTNLVPPEVSPNKLQCKE